MRVFEGFNNESGALCPVCKTSKNKPTVLIPIPDTERDGLVECQQVHKQCYDMVLEMNED